MDIINLYIDKIVIHQIFQRNIDGSKRDPNTSNDFIKFDVVALNTFRTRITSALGLKSKAVPMAILNQGKADLSSMVNQLHSLKDQDYIDASCGIASRLADSQKIKSTPGGILVVFSGHYTNSKNPSKRKFVGIMKAEIHSAYEKLEDKLTKEISLKYVEEALLTPATKLYKTAGFFERRDSKVSGDLNEFWDVLVSDNQIAKGDGKAAAKYFYSDFLGCCYPESSARTTREFYNATCAFLDGLDISDEERSGLYNSLVTYLKHDKSEVINPIEFAESYLADDQIDIFSDYLESCGLPTAFTKDIEQITSKLEYRKLSFSKKVNITAPAEAFKNLIEITSIEQDENGFPVEWTNILVKDVIVSQE
jgi:hypothetical protein